MFVSIQNIISDNYLRLKLQNYEFDIWGLLKTVFIHLFENKYIFFLTSQ
jgi:hypothetical protein